MSLTRRFAPILAAAFMTLALAGCGTKAEGADTISTADVIDDSQATAAAAGGTTGESTSGGTCPAVPQEGTHDVDMAYVNAARDAIPMGGIFLEDLGDNTWGSSLNAFTSDADGRPGFMMLGLAHDPGIAADGTLEGTHEIVGIYCVTLKVAPSSHWSPSAT